LARKERGKRRQQCYVTRVLSGCRSRKETKCGERERERERIVNEIEIGKKRKKGQREKDKGQGFRTKRKQRRERLSLSLSLPHPFPSSDASNFRALFLPSLAIYIFSLFLFEFSKYRSYFRS